MANELTRGPGRGGLPLAFIMPDFPAGTSLALVNAVQSVLNPHPDIGTPLNWLDRIVDEAAHALEAIQPLCEPAPPAVLEAWLGMIARGVEYMPSEEDFAFRLSALCFAAAELPGVAWTQQAQRDGLMSWRKMPSVAAIMELVLPPIAPLLSRRRALQMIASRTY